MKKIKLLSVLFLMLIISCSDKEEIVNEAPTAPILTYQWSVVGEAFILNWEPSIDPEEETIKYDIYLNDEIIELDYEKVSYEFDLRVKEWGYPLVFKIKAKDSNNGVVSNLKKINDPLLGNWFINEIKTEGNGVITVDTLDECQRKSYLFFNENGKTDSFQYYTLNGACELDKFESTWYNDGVNLYNIDGDDLIIKFPDNETFKAYVEFEEEINGVMTEFKSTITYKRK